MKIVAVRVKDFKGVKDVAIRPHPTLVVLTGRNGSGKTSVLDALEAAIGGKGASPEAPVRRGAERAEVVVDLGELMVRRRWDRDGSSRLHLENPDGSRPAKPQALLDALFERVAFDPVRFLAWEPRKQAEVLRSLAGLDSVFAEIEARYRAAYEERADVNRAVRADEAAQARYGPEVEQYPDDPVDVGEVAARYQAAVDERAQNRQIRDSVEHDRARHRRAEQDFERKTAECERLRDALAAAERQRDEAGAAALATLEALVESKETAEGLTDPDSDAALAELNGATAHNRRAAEKAEWRAAKARWEQNREHALKLTSTLMALETEKEARLSEARYPVPGLEVRGDAVTLDGLPLGNLNAARRVTLGLAVGAALNPGLRVALVRDGSLLDGDSLAAMRQWAEHEDFQIWLEVVGSTESPEGVVIEDGEVVADRQGGVARAPAGTTFEQTAREAEEVF